MGANDYAIVVGISRYGSLKPELEGPERDARAFAEWLKKPEGGAVPEGNVKLILSSTYEATNKALNDPFAYEPSLGRVTTEFARLMGQTARNAGQAPRVGERLYIYLAGHGLTPKVDPLTSTNQSALAMANYVEEAQLEYLPGMMYAEWFRLSHSFNEVLLFMDCCREDRPQVQMTSIAMPIVDSGRPNEVRRFYSWATSWDSRSWEMPLGTPAEKRGVFTYALLEALNQGTPDALGRTTPQGVAGHILMRVRELRNNDGSQAPQFLPERPDDSIVLLARPKTPQQTNVTVTFGPALVGKRAELLDGALEPVAAIDISGAPWQLSLNKGAHVIRIEGKDHPILVRQHGEARSEHIDG